MIPISAILHLQLGKLQRICKINLCLIIEFVFLKNAVSSISINSIYTFIIQYIQTVYVVWFYRDKKHLQCKKKICWNWIALTSSLFEFKIFCCVAPIYGVSLLTCQYYFNPAHEMKIHQKTLLLKNSNERFTKKPCFWRIAMEIHQKTLLLKNSNEDSPKNLAFEE